MLTEAKFQYTLKEMMNTKHLSEINVTALCEKCGCHRQTFYYHYADIYDLISAIYLTEDLSDVDSATSTSSVLLMFAVYVRKNFGFLRATYNSAARDITDDFIFNKLNAKFCSLWKGDKKLELKIEGIRKASRRFSHLIAHEYAYCFKDAKLTPERFFKKITKFNKDVEEVVLPSIFELSRKEESKQ